MADDTLSKTLPSSSWSLPKAFFLAGLTVGSLDILSAFVDYMIATGGKNPVYILRYVASGVFGAKALTGGATMALLGLLFHFLIAFAFTAFFFWIYPKFPILARQRLLTGIAYGIFVWAVMNFIVVPMSNTRKAPFTTFRAIKAMVILIFMIGVPLSYLAHRFYYGNRNSGKSH